MKTFLSVLFFCLITVSFVAGQTTPKEKLNYAIYLEEVNGELEKAIQQYENIVKTYPEERAIVAEALYRNGLTNEKLGTQKAKAYYEKVVNSYSDQPEMVKLAQTRLSRIIKNENQNIDGVANLWLSELSKTDFAIINPYEKVKSMQNSTLSSDGTKLAGVDLSTGQNIAVFDLLTGKTLNVTKQDYNHDTKGNGWCYYPVWSPDGTEIAHMFSEWQGEGYELRVTSLEGKVRTLLKSEPTGRKVLPRNWSKDGSKILTFVQDSAGIYTVGLVPSEGGSFKAIYKPSWKSDFTVGDASRASLSPDGKFIVIADGPENKMDVLIIRVDDGTKTVLSDHPANEYTVVWSPDGKHIAFIRDTQGGAFLYAVEVADGKAAGQPFLIKEGMQKVDLNNWTKYGICSNLWIDMFDVNIMPINPESGTPTGEPKLLDFTPSGSNICAVWSHDGKSLAFVSNEQLPKLVIFPVDGSEPAKFNIPVPGLWVQGVYDLSWLPDDSGVGFSWNTGQSTTVYRFDLLSSKWQNWGPDTNSDQRTTLIDWGPDNNSFVYAKWNENLSHKNIPDPGLHRFDINTGKSQLIYQPESDSSEVFRMMKFSRDYKKIVTQCDNNNLIVVDLNLGKSHVLANKYAMPNPTFSPNGEKVLTVGPKNDVTIYSLEGNILEQYSLSKYLESGTACFLPHWSPDGKKLAFQTRKMGRKTYIMRNVLK